MVNDAQYIIDPERIGTLGGVDLSNPYARITPALGASAQDFSFGKSVWNVVDGNPDGESVSGLAGISLIDGEGSNRRGRDNDKDEGGLSWDDVRDARERMQEQLRQISVAGIQMTREELDQAISDFSDPEKRERIAQDYAARNNTTVGKAREEIDRVSQYLLAKRAMEDGNATPEQRALVTEFESDPNARERVERVLEARNNVNAELDASIAAERGQGSRDEILTDLTSDDVTTSNAVVANVEDESLWEDARVAQGYGSEEIDYAQEMRSGGSESLSFLGDDPRQGPVITSVYNATSSGVQQAAEAETGMTPFRPSTLDQALG